jgi:hypothetical protein
MPAVTHVPVAHVVLFLTTAFRVSYLKVATFDNTRIYQIVISPFKSRRLGKLQGFANERKNKKLV